MVTIRYQDIALGAAEDATVTSNGAQSFSNLALLPFGDASSKATFQLGGWGLDGTFQSVYEVPYWSAEISDENGIFETAPQITITFSKEYSSTAITLLFPVYDYCKNITVQWYNGNTLLSEKTYTITDEILVKKVKETGVFVCENPVYNFDKVVITLNNTFLPYQSAKLGKVIIGSYRDFSIDELRTVQVTNKSNLISASIPISQLKLTLDSSDVEFIFQYKQPIKVLVDNNTFCIYYVQEAHRFGKTLYEVTCHDVIGILETIPFAGKVYESQSAQELLTELVGGRFPLYITAEDKIISGAIMAGNLREAIRQVLFAWGATAATDNCDGIRVFNLTTNVKIIQPNKTYNDVSVKRETAVTKVNVTSHEYTETQDGNIEIDGKKYNDTTDIFTIDNPVTNTQENVIDITDATLVSTDTVQSAAQNVFNSYVDRAEINATILWDGEKIGDYLLLHNLWNGVESGHIEKLEMTFSSVLAAKLTIRKSRSGSADYFESGELYAGEDFGVTPVTAN